MARRQSRWIRIHYILCTIWLTLVDRDNRDPLMIIAMVIIIALLALRFVVL